MLDLPITHSTGTKEKERELNYEEMSTLFFHIKQK